MKQQEVVSDEKAPFGEFSSFSKETILVVLDLIDHFLSLAEGDSPIFFAAEAICEPENLSQLISLSVEASEEIQFRTHRVLQTILRLDVPVEVLN